MRISRIWVQTGTSILVVSWFCSTSFADEANPSADGVLDTGTAEYTEQAASVEVTAQQALLFLSKDASIDQATPGTVLVYTIIAENDGPADVSGVYLRDNLYDSALANVSWICVQSESTALCPPPPHDTGTGNLEVPIDLEAGTHLRYDVSATAEHLGIVINRAELDPAVGIADQSSVLMATYEVVVVPQVVFEDGFEIPAVEPANPFD